VQYIGFGPIVVPFGIIVPRAPSPLCVINCSVFFNNFYYFRPYPPPPPHQQCFFARLGFVQPPTCLRCAYRASGCEDGERIRFAEKDGARRGGRGKGGGQSPLSTTTSSCNELVPWRRDANVPLHPDKLEGNILFITCDTAKSLVNGDAYPSIRWDARHKCLLYEV
jgi:hypothetical protein